MVYFHQKSMAYEEMLKLYMQSSACAYRLPADLEAYRRTDDSHLLAHLRASDDEWARRIVDLAPLKVVFESIGVDGDHQLTARLERLSAAGIFARAVPGHGVVYGQRKAGMPPIYVVDRHQNPGHVQPVEEATGVFERYQNERCVGRLYVRPEDRVAALAALA
jgi:hypothetical protein